MKHLNLAVICLAIIVFLTACSVGSNGKTEELVDELRVQYVNLTNFSAEIEIRADYGDYVWDYTIEYSGTQESGNITVLAPDLIAGLTAQYNGEESSLIFEDAVLDTGELTTDGLTPLGAVPTLIKSWKEGYVTESYSEELYGESMVVIGMSITNNVSQKTWFSQESYLPIKSEIIEDGNVVIICVFNNIYMS